MSASSISRAATDPQLLARVNALAQKEARGNSTLGDTVFGRDLMRGMIDASPLMWAVAVDYEAAYETALTNGRGAPGHDVDIITDANISAAVQAHWPQDPTAP